jgi:hypothetical protein
MKIILEAEVMEHRSGESTPSMYLPDHCRVLFRVVLGDQEFNHPEIIGLDEVQCTSYSD